MRTTSSPTFSAALAAAGGGATSRAKARTSSFRPRSRFRRLRSAAPGAWSSPMGVSSKCAFRPASRTASRSGCAGKARPASAAARRAMRSSPSPSRPIPISNATGAICAWTCRSRLKEAVLGAKVPVPTLTGPVTLTVPPHSNSGRVLRLKGQRPARRRRRSAGRSLCAVGGSAAGHPGSQARCLRQELGQ